MRIRDALIVIVAVGGLLRLVLTGQAVPAAVILAVSAVATVMYRFVRGVRQDRAMARLAADQNPAAPRSRPEARRLRRRRGDFPQDGYRHVAEELRRARADTARSAERRHSYQEDPGSTWM
ncbi:hypothetical protein [Mycobacterium aquaticum]|uniref:Uncharacterized protein n=1 Tax=Mycobacterium aquaticum TaxID=1927124 RepID=A0A1X0AY53_9MYCO|nr:hypothetical protein [Mycobacterium aquaticum]ORA35017.1 hypothetical protein BST13_15045 [Mycobacterium aquaticum]